MYVIVAKSRFGNEELEECTDEKEAEYLVREYSVAFGPLFHVFYFKRG